MRFTDWEPIYEQILSDMGYSRSEDESSVRVLKASTIGSDLVDPEELSDMFGTQCTVFGAAGCLESDVSQFQPRGTLIAAGSVVPRLLVLGIQPDVIVTDLDGDIESQLKASRDGAVTFLHAHGDNADLIRMWAGTFEGPVVLTTQSRPESTVFNFGGFTDGDRAVCIAQEMGCRDILLLGFDFEKPFEKEGSYPEIKRRKLSWARTIIGSLEGLNLSGPFFVRS